MAPANPTAAPAEKAKNPFDLEASSKPTEKRKTYLVGLLPMKTKGRPPAFVVTLGGISVPFRTSYPDPEASKEAGETIRQTRYGDLVDLTDSEVDRVVEAVRSRIVRTTLVNLGSEKKADLREKPTVYSRDVVVSGINVYSPEEEDAPLAKFVYLVAVDDVKDGRILAQDGKRFPRSLYDTAKPTGA